MQSLKELKEENARIEAEELAKVTQAKVEDTVEDEAAEVVEEELDESADLDGDEETKAPVESWMQSEADDSQDDSEGVDDSAIWATARKKYKAKSEKEKEAHNEELAQLKAEVEALKTQKSTVTAPTGKPKREDYFHLDDPDEAYVDALVDWKSNHQVAQQTQAQQQAHAKSAIDQLNSLVDQHYDRAAKLAKANNIEPEVYQQADAYVRNLIGEDITNALIARMGEGSEKVMFNLGRNPRKLAELKGALNTDTSGLTAMMMLGKWSAELTPQKRKSNAPAPAATVQGGSKTGNVDKRLKADYDKAYKSGNATKAFNLKREAKKAGANTRDW